MTAATPTPGQADPPALFVRWYRIESPKMSDRDIAEMWAMSTRADREFWTEVDAQDAAQAAIAAQDARPAPALREALEAMLKDWRDDAAYSITDTRDEITEHHAVSVCADQLAGILADYPETEPRPAPELAAP